MTDPVSALVAKLRDGIVVGMRLSPDGESAIGTMPDLRATVALMAEAATAIATLQGERDAARQLVRDIYWMAVRYADGRKSYAPGMCNDALRKAYDAGWLTYRDDKRHDLDPQYARDGDKPEYRSVEARAETAEAALAEAMKALEDLTSKVRSFELADDEMRRADNAGTQPRMQRAGNRLYSARQRLLSSAHLARSRMEPGK